MLDEMYDISERNVDTVGDEDVTDGSVDYYDFDWGEAVEVDEGTIFNGCPGNTSGGPLYDCPDPCENWPYPCPDPDPDPEPCPCPEPCPDPDPDPDPQPGPCEPCEGDEEMPNDGADYGIIDL